MFIAQWSLSKFISIYVSEFFHVPIIYLFLDLPGSRVHGPDAGACLLHVTAADCIFLRRVSQLFLLPFYNQYGLIFNWIVLLP